MAKNKKGNVKRKKQIVESQRKIEKKDKEYNENEESKKHIAKRELEIKLQNGVSKSKRPIMERSGKSRRQIAKIMLPKMSPQRQEANCREHWQKSKSKKKNKNQVAKSSIKKAGKNL